MSTERELFEEWWSTGAGNLAGNERGWLGAAWAAWQARAASTRSAGEPVGQPATPEPPSDDATWEAWAVSASRALRLDLPFSPTPDVAAIRVLFLAWAREHMGQGYSLETDESGFDDPVTRWCEIGFAAGLATQAQPATHVPAEPLTDAARLALEDLETATAFTSRKSRDRHAKTVAALRAALAATSPPAPAAAAEAVVLSMRREERESLSPGALSTLTEAVRAAQRTVLPPLPKKYEYSESDGFNGDTSWWYYDANQIDAWYAALMRRAHAAEAALAAQPVVPAGSEEFGDPRRAMTEEERQEFCIALSFEQDDYTEEVIRAVEARMLAKPLFVPARAAAAVPAAGEERP